jgi:hypothetical protein
MLLRVQEIRLFLAQAEEPAKGIEQAVMCSDSRLFTQRDLGGMKEFVL